MFKHLKLKFVVALFLQTAFVLAAFAQVDRATLEGTVTDPSGAAVAGATVKISAVETGLTQERTTNSNGYYRFPGIAIGDYTVFVSYKGFKTKSIEDIRVQVGQTRTLDVALEIGDASDKIVVQVDLTPEDRSSAESSAVIGADQIENLPLNGRNWASLTRLAPWAQDDGGGDQRTIRFAGRGRDDNNFSFDGVDASGIQEQAQKAEVRLQVSPEAVFSTEEAERKFRHDLAYVYPPAGKTVAQGENDETIGHAVRGKRDAAWFPGKRGDEL